MQPEHSNSRLMVNGEILPCSQSANAITFATWITDSRRLAIALPENCPEGKFTVLVCPATESQPSVILTFPRARFGPLPESGCWPVTSLSHLRSPLWQVRADVEQDETLLQPIAYLLLRNALGKVWCYQRAGGDARLDACYSCGVGGHVDLADSVPLATHPNTLDIDATVRNTLLRELCEELHATPTDMGDLCLRGLVYEGLSPIGRVHIGVLYTAQWLPEQPPQPRAGEVLRGLGFMELADISRESRFELWTHLAVQHLMHLA